MVRKIFLAVILLSLTTIFSHFGYAQILYENTGHIPTTNQLHWTNAGLMGERQFYADHLLDVTKFGATKDNDSNDDGKGIIAAIDSAKKLEGLSIIYFPKGSYLIKQPIIIEYDDATGWNGNIVFQGDGSDSTFLNFQLNNPDSDCFYIKGEQIGNENDGYIELTQDIPKDSKGLHANSFSSLDDSSWIRLSEFGFSVHDSWAEGSIGQITRAHLDAADSLYAEMEDPASKEYLASNDLRVWQIHPVENIGFESFKIRRYDGKSTSSDHGHNIKLEYAVNCWIRGVEFSNTSKHHVEAEFSSHIEISGCYFHHAESYDDGGFGYGVILQLSTTNCLVENNVFEHLRHAMLVQAGANCNVFEFNYSTDQTWNYSDQGPDLCIHGNYPYGNLFEHNFVEYIEADDSHHGFNGKFNAFIRNRAHVENSSDQYIKFDNTEKTSVIGCQLTLSEYQHHILWINSSDYLDLYGYYECNQEYSRKHDDIVSTSEQQNCCNQDVSYFYSEAPYFLEGFSFPSIGPKPTSNDAYPPQDIPARDRYKNSTPKTSIYYETKHPKIVRVDQKDSNLNSFGLISHWEKLNGSYAWKDTVAPHTYEFKLQSDQVIKAEQDLHNNEKFNNWNNNEFLLNHNTFTINSDLNEITAYFDHVSNIFVKSELGNYGSYNTVKLKDPWYQDYDEQPYGKRNQGMSAPPLEIPAPYKVSVDSNRQGVFLDQGYDGTNWSPPYYSVKAAEKDTFTAHGQNITGYFLNWVGTEVSFQSPDNLETPVAFHADNAEARAVYKGHLASSVARATGYNNGRRIFKANNGTLYLVYEDNGDIWFTSSSDNGKTWNKEIKINSASNCINPAIAGTEDLDYVFVTWFDKTNRYIKFRYFNINNSQWSDIYEFNDKNINYGTSIDPHPSIGAYVMSGNSYVFIAFNCEKIDSSFIPNGTGISQIECYKGTYYGDFNDWTKILGPFDGNNPSINCFDKEDETAIVWDHEGKIFFKSLNSDGIWSSTKQISDDLWYHTDNCKPNISYFGHIAHIVWEGFHAITEMPTGYYRYYDVYNDILGDLTEVPCGGADVYNLSVSSDINNEDANEYDYTIFYEADGIEKVDQTGNSFTQENFGEGKYPNIVDHGRDRAVWTQYTDAPYFLQTDYQDENNGGGISPVVPVYPTPIADYIISAQTNNSVEGDITLNIEHVILNHDTVYFDNSLNSQTMSVTQDYVPLEMDLKVRFHNVNTGLNDDDVLYSVVFGDSANETFLTNLKYRELPETNGNDFEKFLKVTTIVNLAGQTGKLRLKFNGVQPALVTKQLKVGEGDALGKNVSRKPVIPKAFALHQNFPNPFNPTTHITVDLPQDARVHLAVYNVTGQKVAELMNGSKPAGTYEIVFDGKNLASGVYIYRLTTDKGFVQSKKMMLIR